MPGAKEIDLLFPNVFFGEELGLKKKIASGSHQADVLRNLDQRKVP